MADRTRNESITESITKTLAEYLEEESDTIRQTIIDFPEPNLKLKMPSVSVMAPSMEFEPTGNPYRCNNLPDSGNKAKVQYVVGEAVFPMQLDIWAGNKEELDDTYEEVFNLLNPDVCNTGLRLEMVEYFKIPVIYLITGHNRENSETASQRDEWRITLNVLATCKVVRTKKEFIIRETEVQVDVCRGDEPE